MKHYELALPASSQNIREATMEFRELSKLRKIELMVEARVMTSKQAERARKKLSEINGE